MTKITEYLEMILEGQGLSFEEAKSLLDIIFDGQVADVQVAAFLAAMRAKDTTCQEIAGFASSLREHMVKVNVDIDNVIDTCGTGGAKVKTFNISTAAAFVVAGGGGYIAKHGNRAITSNCGSADVLCELGVKIDLAAKDVAACIEQCRIGFMFAPMFHPAMKFVQPVRKALDFRTAFNILGPLANPAGAKFQVMGVPDEKTIEKVVNALEILGSKRAMVVHSDGLDEISTLGVTKVAMLDNGNISRFEISPEKFGMARATSGQLQGGNAVENANVIRNILSGKEKGAKKDIVILNAAAAIMVGMLAEDFETAIGLAQEAIKNGSAMKALDNLIRVSNSF